MNYLKIWICNFQVDSTTNIVIISWIKANHVDQVHEKYERNIQRSFNLITLINWFNCAIECRNVWSFNQFLMDPSQTLNNFVNMFIFMMRIYNPWCMQYIVKAIFSHFKNMTFRGLMV